MHDILLWYLTHKPSLICERLYQAGRRLQNNWELASNRSNISGISSTHVRCLTLGNSQSINVANLKAEYYHKVLDALHYVGKPYLDQILIDTVCHGDAMQIFEKKFQLRSGVGSFILKIALHKLHEHYAKVDKYNYTINSV